MRTLDRTRVYGSIFPPGLVAFEQDGLEFDHAGNEVAKAEPEAPPAPDVDLAAMKWPALRKLASELAIPEFAFMKRPQVEAAVSAALAAQKQTATRPGQMLSDVSLDALRELVLGAPAGVVGEAAA